VLAKYRWGRDEETWLRIVAGAPRATVTRAHDNGRE